MGSISDQTRLTWKMYKNEVNPACPTALLSFHPQDWTLYYHFQNDRHKPIQNAGRCSLPCPLLILPWHWRPQPHDVNTNVARGDSGCYPMWVVSYLAHCRAILVLAHYCSDPDCGVSGTFCRCANGKTNPLLWSFTVPIMHISTVTDNWHVR
jgi:hypothetical protein